MPPPPDLLSYRLSPAESQHIFHTRIVPLDIDPIPPSPNPREPLAILAVGQTGAGKTCLVPSILSALSTGGRKPVHLIADVYKTHHPAYTSLPGNLASPATGPDSRIWLSMAGEEAARRRQDVLIESACRHPSDFTSLASIFRAASYRVTVLVLAVPYPLSRLGILVRYYQNLPEAQSRGLPLRLTPTKVHDDSYEGLLKAAEWLDHSRTADRVLVVRRGNLIAYADVKDEQGGMKAGAAEAVRMERQRPLTNGEIQAAQDGLEKLRTFEEATAHLAEINELLNPLLEARSTVNPMEFPKLQTLVFENEPTADNVLRLNILN